MTLIHYVKTQSQIWWRSMTINSTENSAAHAQSREAMSRPATAAGLQPPSQEAAHFVLTSSCFFCCWPFPSLAPQRPFPSILAPLSPPLPHSSLANCLLFKAPSFPPSNSFRPLFQTHRGNLSTSNHAAGASYSFPLCLPVSSSGYPCWFNSIVKHRF